jgi:indolepyruvate ferredoxin oxidoreductase
MTALDIRTLDRQPYDLGDRYRTGTGPVVLTGVQAIARALVEQHERDARAGLRVATFVSGYQGSPLGGVDRMLAAMPEVLAAHDITFVPGLNEELAATSVWGSQAELPMGTATHDGVVGVWYGKGPGLDRATDALRHANMYGANPRGGMLLLVGDDPASKSSTVPAVSERSLAALGIPVLFPRNAREIVTMAMHGVAMSRASGCAVALKIVADVADGAWSVDDSDVHTDIVVPQVRWEGRPFVYRQRPMAAPTDSLDAEADLYGPRAEVVRAYGAANALDAIELDPPHATIGIASTGTTFDSVRQALADLGADDFALHRAGVRLLRIGMPTPLGPDTVGTFAEGLEEILVVEDKTAFVETQVREILYGRADAPRIIGKKDAAGRVLIPAGGELTAGRLLAPLRRVLGAHLADRLELKKPPLPALALEVLPAKRAAYFCSGCPHNRSTAVPEGSLAGGGIGCHTMVTISGRTDSAVTGLTQMGGEGSQWIGQAPFTDVPHLIQNIGDGTFFHSGQLAVQACVAAGVNITYKLLYNEVVAMTGAQDAEGALTVAKLTHKLVAEGVRKIIICADEPHRHDKRALAKGTVLWHRDRLDEAQKRLRDVEGVTVLIYDQHCAADARRQRKRGTLPTRTTRLLINEAVCEGCGDCGVKSNCLSVQPVDTEFGRKTRIDQTSCNTDYSCLDGDCPSFVTVEVQPGMKSRTPSAPEPPVLADLDVEPVTSTHNVFFAGIGGTGIVTVSQVLATAALRAGYDVESLDQIGLSQKAGPVVSHLRFAAGKLDPSNRLTPGSADCILAFDLLAAADTKNLGYGDHAKTISVASTSKTPTGDMVYDKTITYPETAYLLNRLGQVSRTVYSLDALPAARHLFGSTAAANFLLIGAAYQAGALRLPAESIEEAIELNGVAVRANVAAFRWGRAAIADPARFDDVVTPVRDRQPPPPARVLAGTTFSGQVGDLISRRTANLVQFQSEKVARRYVTLLQSIWTAERAVGNRTEFSEAVAKGLYKFTAYKDEYEVARLLTDPQFLSYVKSEVPVGEKLTYKLHPPVLRAMGRKKKIGLGPRSHVALRILAKGKRLRGTKFDPFGYAHVRTVERSLITGYADIVKRLAAELDPNNYDRAVEVAALADMVRGYEDVKLASVEAYHARLSELGITASSTTAWF